MWKRKNRATHVLVPSGACYWSSNFVGIRTRPIVKHVNRMVTLHCRICFAGEVKVLVSGDGGNFEEAACWKQSQRQDVAYSETIFFQKPTNVKAPVLVGQFPGA